jgi:hypothetical protein
MPSRASCFHFDSSQAGNRLGQCPAASVRAGSAAPVSADIPHASSLVDAASRKAPPASGASGPRNGLDTGEPKSHVRLTHSVQHITVAFAINFFSGLF